MTAHAVRRTGMTTVIAAVLLAACPGTPKPAPETPPGNDPMAPPREEPVVLEAPPPVVSLSVDDLSSGEVPSLSVSISGLALRAGAPEGEAERIRKALKGGLRLLDENGRPVAGEVRFGLYSVDGKTMENRSDDALSFVPADPLREGWYTLRARVDVLAKQSRGGPSLVGHHERLELVARFFRGQRLFARRLQVHCTELRRSPPVHGAESKRLCYFSVDLSAPASHGWANSAAGSVEIRYNGQVQSCTPVDRSYRRMAEALVFACQEPSPRTRIEISSGTVPSAAGGGPASWTLDFPDQLENVGSRSQSVWIAALPVR